jgi:hypothetical protein
MVAFVVNILRESGSLIGLAEGPSEPSMQKPIRLIYTTIVVALSHH